MYIDVRSSAIERKESTSVAKLKRRMSGLESVRWLQAPAKANPNRAACPGLELRADPVIEVAASELDLRDIPLVFNLEFFAARRIV